VPVDSPELREPASARRRRWWQDHAWLVFGFLGLAAIAGAAAFLFAIETAGVSARQGPRRAGPEAPPRRTDAAVEPAVPARPAEPAPPPDSAPPGWTDRGFAVKAGDTIRDCPQCPLLVVVPPGRFDMGSPAGEAGRGEEEGPMRAVSVPRPLAMARHEVTRAQWSAFARASGRRSAGGCWLWSAMRPSFDRVADWREPGFAQTEDDPVVCVSWREVQAYLAWLNDKQGRRYRLPSEAEWEYAARAGAGGPRPWAAAAASCAHANGADAAAKKRFPDWSALPCEDGYAHTAPVGRFAGNAFGLQDMIGNAWEWTQDCWAATLDGLPAEAGPRAAGDCGKRAIRGGGWTNDARMLRSAARTWLGAEARSNNVGFRIVRELE
jgi:formylglycine-generating enzyme required for sulfatase activity